MLRYLRENTGNWIIKIFLLIIVVVFVFLGVGSMNAKRHNQVATVNDEPITIKEFQSAYNNMTQRLRQQFGNSLNEDLLKALNVKQQAVNSLIDQKLLTMEADRLKLTVSDQEVQDAILGSKAFQKDGKFNMDLYNGILARNGMTPEIYEGYQRQSLRENKLRSMILDSVTVSDAEAKNWYTFQNTKMSINYIDIDPSTLTGMAPTQEEIEKEFKDNSDKYKSQPQRRVEYLVFSPADHAGQAGITDEQVKSYYDQHKGQFENPEKVEASHILIRVAQDADETAVEAARKEAQDVYDKAVKGDQSFEDLAKKFSQGPTASRGGYLGVFEKQSMVKPFGDAAFSMKPGEISKPVKTQFGWHVIKVTKHMDASVTPFEKAAAGIRTQLEKEAGNNLAYYKAGEAYDAVVDGDDFEQVALIAKKEIKKTEAFTADGQGLDMPHAREFAGEVFSIADDGISEVKEFGDDYYLIKVLEKIDPKPLSLEDVRADIIVSLTAQKQKEAALKKAKDLLKQGKSSIEQIAKDNTLEVKVSKLFTRNQPIPGIPGSTSLVQAAFKLTSENKVCTEVLEASNHYYLIGVKEIQIPGEDEMKTAIDGVKKEMIGRKQQNHFLAWMQSVRQKAEITINKDIIN